MLDICIHELVYSLEGEFRNDHSAGAVARPTYEPDSIVGLCKFDLIKSMGTSI